MLMFACYYFKMEKEEFVKLNPLMHGLENILESASVYYSDKLGMSVIETRGVSIEKKITQAKEYLSKNKISYELTKAVAKSPYELKHI